ncbi:hypothetical protein BC828DRAFT_384216 [Blastocladiella britannica]|nr:hypothetical protein BC828DRAFT_384216 [Blastocladiella britannica]
MAVRGGHLKVLEWWDRNKGMLPPQVLDCPLDFSGRIASKDAVDLLAWWNDRFPISDDEWQRICLFAIEKNALRVQSWLRGHRDLFTLDTDNLHLHLMEEHSFTLRHPRPFTLDFLNSVYPDLVMDPTLPLPESFYLSWTLMLWLCARANVTVASLLPLQPIALMMLLIHHDVLTLERWLQAYITAGHPFVLPDADKVYDHERAWMEVDDTRPICQRQDSLHRWMYDVTVTRKIAVFETTGSGTFVLYMSPPFSFSS